jgi:predicted RNA binding protein YcfA (HicA-like mRNA interferase family)
MDSVEVTRHLEMDGWKLIGGKGDHRKYRHPERGLQVVIPCPRKDIPIGTLRQIYRQAGWEWRK